MRVVATFEVNDKQTPTLRHAIEQVAPQVHLLAPIVIQEFLDEQVPRDGRPEDGLGLIEQGDDQDGQQLDAGLGLAPDGDGELAGRAGQDPAGGPEQLDADAGALRPVSREKGRAVKPKKG